MNFKAISNHKKKKLLYLVLIGFCCTNLYGMSQNLMGDDMAQSPEEGFFDAGDYGFEQTQQFASPDANSIAPISNSFLDQMPASQTVSQTVAQPVVEKKLDIAQRDDTAAFAANLVNASEEETVDKLRLDDTPLKRADPLDAMPENYKTLFEGLDLSDLEDDLDDVEDAQPMPVSESLTADVMDTFSDEELDLDEPQSVTTLATASTKINAMLPTISIAVGSVFELAPLPKGEYYFVTDPEHKHCLTHATDSNGLMIYTLQIMPGMTTDTFTIFKGHGTEHNPIDLRPALHIQIKGLDDEHDDLEDTGTRIKIALEKQEQAEQHLLDTVLAAIESYRKENAEIWFNLTPKTQEEKVADKNSILEKYLHLKVGESSVVATGGLATVQSNHPFIAIAHLEHPSEQEKNVWNVVVTGKESGHAIIRYTIDGKTYKLPVVVKKALKIAKK